MVKFPAVAAVGDLFDYETFQSASNNDQMKSK